MAAKLCPMDNIFQQYRHICSQLDCQPAPSYLSALRSQSSSCVIEQLSSEQSDLQLYALASTLPYSKITNLTLNRATAGVSTWWSFFEAVRRTAGLTHLAVTNSTLDESKGRDRTLMDVGNKVGQLQLHTLDLSGTLLSSVLFQVIARGSLMRFQHLERLNLSECSLSDDTIRVLCNSIGSALITSGPGIKLKDLRLAGNRITQIGALALARLLSGEVTDRPLKLSTLDLQKNKINDLGGEALATALQNGSALECLNISHNPIGDSCLMEMATIWRRIPGTLKELHVSGVGERCTVQGSMAFLQGVSKSSSLRVLDIRSLNLASMLVTHALGRLLCSHKDLQVLLLDIGGMDELRELMPALIQNKGLITLWLGMSLERAQENQVLDLCLTVANILEGNAAKVVESGVEVKGMLTVFNHASNQPLLVTQIPRANGLGDDVHGTTFHSNGEVMEDIRSRHDKQISGLSSEGSSLLDTGSISGSLPSYVSEASFRQDSPVSSRRSERRDWNNHENVDLPKFPNLSVRTSMQRAADLASPRSSIQSSKTTKSSQPSGKAPSRSSSSGSGSQSSPNSPLTPIDPWAPFSCTPRTTLSGTTPRVGFTPRSTMSGMTPFGKGPVSMFNRTPATPGSVFNVGTRTAAFTPKTPFSVFGTKPRVPRPMGPSAATQQQPGGPIAPAMSFRKHDKDDDMLLNLGEMVMALQDTSILHGLPALKLSNYLQDYLNTISKVERPTISLPEFMQCYEAVCSYKTNHFRRQRAVRYPIGAGTNKALRRVFRAYSTPNTSSFMHAAHSPQQPIMNSEQFHQLCTDAGFLQPTGLLTPLTMDIIFAQCKTEERSGLSWLDFLKALVMIGQDNESNFDAVESSVMNTPIAIALRPPSPPRMHLLEDGKWSPRSRTSRSPRSPASARWSPRSGSGSSYRSPRSAASFKRSPMSTPRSATPRSARSTRSERRTRSPATLAAIKSQLLSESDNSSDNSLTAGEKLITCKFNQVLDSAPKHKITESLSDSSNAIPEDLSESSATPPTAGSQDSAPIPSSSPRKKPRGKPAVRAADPNAPSWAASGAGTRRAMIPPPVPAKLSTARPPIANANRIAPGLVRSSSSASLRSSTTSVSSIVPASASSSRSASPAPRAPSPVPTRAPSPTPSRPPLTYNALKPGASKPSAPSVSKPTASKPSAPKPTPTPSTSSTPRFPGGSVNSVNTTSRGPWMAAPKPTSSAPPRPASPTGKSVRSTRSSFSHQSTPAFLLATYPRTRPVAAKSTPKSVVSQSLDSGIPRLTAELLAGVNGPVEESPAPAKRAFLKRRENISTVSAPAFCSVASNGRRSSTPARPAWNSSGKLVQKKVIPDGRWP